MRTYTALAAILVLSSSAAAQSYQTLPRGFDVLPGTSSTGFPFTLSFYTEHVWQWHYDTSQFDATGPVEITEIYVRTTATQGTGTFDFPSLEVTLASSPTDYSVLGNGIQLGHDPIFANNLNPDATVVRPASQFSGAGFAAQAWVPLDLSQSFVYDPTQGDDFVLELRSCGILDMWDGALDGATGSTGTVFGNRYGDRVSCGATVQTFFNDEFVPIIRIEYAPFQAGPALAVSAGAPGGPMSFDFSGFTASATAAVVYGPAGQLVVPNGPCIGLALDVVPRNFPPPSSLILVPTDANGDAVLSQFVPAAGAGVSVQAVDVPSCETTNTVVL